jgi:hypothetical protein
MIARTYVTITHSSATENVQHLKNRDKALEELEKEFRASGKMKSVTNKVEQTTEKDKRQSSLKET